MKKVFQYILLVSFYFQLIFGVLYKLFDYPYTMIKYSLPFTFLFYIFPTVFWTFVPVYIYSKIKPRNEGRLFQPINYLASTRIGSTIIGILALLVFSILGIFFAKATSNVF